MLYLNFIRFSKRIFLILYPFIMFSCQEKQVNKSEGLDFRFEKVIVVNNGEFSTVYFKLRIRNQSDRIYTLINLPSRDINNRSKENYDKRIGFYLSKDNTNIPLSLGVETYYKVKEGFDGYFYLGSNDFDFIENDTLKLKKELLNYTLNYKGNSSLIEKNKHHLNIVEGVFTIGLPQNIIIRLVDEVPITREEWDSL